MTSVWDSDLVMVSLDNAGHFLKLCRYISHKTPRDDIKIKFLPRKWNFRMTDVAFRSKEGEFNYLLFYNLHTGSAQSDLQGWPN